MGESKKETEIQWVKHGKDVSLSLLGKDVVVLSNNHFITFMETSRPDKKEILYQATNEVRGDGVQCLCTHKTLPCFAFAEICRNPRILIVSYPNFEVIKSFESVTDSHYIDLKFSEMEFLVALTGIPDFKIVIWNWRTAEKLYSQETKLEHPQQCLSVSPTSPIEIAQSSCTDLEINFWSMNLCYKKVLLNKISKILPESVQPPFCFSHGADGDLYLVDSVGSLYWISSDTHECILQFPWMGTNKSLMATTFVPCLTWYKGGILFSGPGLIQFWRRKSPEGWVKICVLHTQTPLKKLVSSSLKDLIIGVNTMNEIMTMKGETQFECVTVKSFGSDFDFFCFVYPVGDYFVTFGNSSALFTVWSETNGQRMSSMRWTKRKINALESNPKLPYVVAVSSDGKAHVINVYDPTFIMEFDEIHLTTNSLDSVRFRGQGSQFCVASMEVGEFFLLKLLYMVPNLNYFRSDEQIKTNNPEKTDFGDGLDKIQFKGRGHRRRGINHVTFVDSGKLLPLKLEVVAYLKLDLKIVDFALIDEEAVQANLLIVPMSQLCCRSGQTILWYVSEEKTKSFHYVKDIMMPSITTSIMASPSSERELFCIAHRSRRFYLMNINNGKVLKEFVSGHQMKLISMRSEKDYLLTYGVDGIVIVKLKETNDCVTIFSSHHRLAKGIKALAVDPYMKYVLTLGEDGSLACTHLKKIGDTSLKAENESSLGSPAVKQLLGAPVLAEKAKMKAFEKMMQQSLDPFTSRQSYSTPRGRIWLTLREQENINMEEQHSRKERQSIVEEFSEIRKKLRTLLDENYANVPERQLPVQAFDLDKVARRKKLDDGKLEREKEKQIQLATMKNLNKITEAIKKMCWDSIAVKAREIHAILAPISVRSYALLPEVRHKNLRVHWLPESMKIEKFFQKGDFFEPWIPRTDVMLEMHINRKFQVSSLDVTQIIKTRYEEEQPEDERAKQKSEEQTWHDIWRGTSSHQFIDLEPNHYSQFEMVSFLQCHKEIQLIEAEVKKLMIWFNKEFADTFALKDREMASVCDRNNRLRHIINELNFFHFSPNICKTQIYDPVWMPEENPESLLQVQDSEISVPKYITESQMALIKKQEMEEERLRRLLMEDDFKERALITMMDGVLEKLWEDELKKDVVKPKCMTEKEPETWNEDDLRAIRAYEDAVKFLTSERERYRKILEAEWSKNIALMKDNVSKFDEKISRLHLLKLKVESAIGQEILKVERIREKCYKRNKMDRTEESIKSNLLKNEKKIESMSAELNKLVEMLSECRNNYEALQNKDRNLDKNFKKEFMDYSPMICEQLYKSSKKRPKLLQKATTYATVLNDMGKCAVSGSKPEYMPLECIQYLKDLDALDAHSNAPASVSQQSWELACKLRRTKVECELKIRACAIDLADAEATVSNYHKALKAVKDYQVQLQNDLQALRSEKLDMSLNYQIQLVLKKGLVEVPLSGSLDDFSECILVTKDTLNEVNKLIHKMGSQKIKAMEKAANFRKGIIYKEWEHEKLRMEIEDHKSQLETVEKLQVLKELQAILVARARGFSDEKGFLYLENELTAVKELYQKNQTEIFAEMDYIDQRIQKINSQNKELDEKIMELNVEVNELNMCVDKDFEKRNEAENTKRMKKVRERSKLVRTIQEQHNEILLLQTEVELLRLKTYPTIKYKMF